MTTKSYYYIKISITTRQRPQARQHLSLRVVFAVALTLVPVVGALDSSQLASTRALSLPLISSSLPKLPVSHLHQVSRLIHRALEPLYRILDRLVLVLNLELNSIQFRAYESK